MNEVNGLRARARRALWLLPLAAAWLAFAGGSAEPVGAVGVALRGSDGAAFGPLVPAVPPASLAGLATADGGPATGKRFPLLARSHRACEDLIAAAVRPAVPAPAVVEPCRPMAERLTYYATAPPTARRVRSIP